MGVTPGGKIGNCTCGIHHRCQNPPKKSRLLCGKNGSFSFLTRLTRYRGRIRSSEPAPGEVSLAHNGVHFLDELPEFHRSTLEVMRQPLEDGKVTVSRAAGSLTFPCEFMLVAAMNPCPCGHFGDLRRECRCAPSQVQKYRNRLSRPLMDRIDIHIEVPAM